MGWLDRVTDSLGLGADSRARQYTRAGAAAGLPGMLGGYIVGRIMDGRSNGADVAAAQTGQQTNLDAFGDRLNAASGAWNVNLGDPQSAGVRAGPPSDLAGGALLSSGQQPTGGASPWYDDVSMGAADPLGLVPDYGGDQDRDGRMNPGERRDAAQGGYGVGGKFAGTPFAGSVTNMMANGSQMILGSGDPNGRYRNRGVDYGG
jgi:hypothetical protein